MRFSSAHWDLKDRIALSLRHLHIPAPLYILGRVYGQQPRLLLQYFFQHALHPLPGALGPGSCPRTGWRRIWYAIPLLRARAHVVDVLDTDLSPTCCNSLVPLVSKLPQQGYLHRFRCPRPFTATATVCTRSPTPRIMRAPNTPPRVTRPGRSVMLQLYVGMPCSSSKRTTPSSHPYSSIHARSQAEAFGNRCRLPGQILFDLDSRREACEGNFFERLCR